MHSEVPTIELTSQKPKTPLVIWSKTIEPIFCSKVFYEKQLKLIFQKKLGYDLESAQTS